MIEAFGHPESMAIKRRVTEAVAAHQPPSAMALTRHGRTSIRIALRQMKAAGFASPVLPAWLENFDPLGLGGEEDDASLHHDG